MSHENDRPAGGRRARSNNDELGSAHQQEYHLQRCEEF